MYLFKDKTRLFATLSDIRLLLWKNFLIQIRHPVMSLVELFLPCLLVFILSMFRRTVDVSSYTNVTTWQSFDLIPSNVIQLYNQSSSLRSSTTTTTTTATPITTSQRYLLMYAPQNEVIERIISDTIRQMNDDIIDEGGNSGDGSGYFNNHNITIHPLPFNSTTSMTNYYLTEYDESNDGIMLGGVHFLNYTLPKIHFILRFTSIPRQLRGKNNRESWETIHIMPELTEPGPRERDDADGGKPGYAREGFLWLQHHLTLSTVRVAHNEDRMAVDRHRQLIKATNDGEAIRKVRFRLQRFPFPPYVLDWFLFALSFLFPAIIVFSFIYSSVNLSKNLVIEKEKRLKESMKMMGMKEKDHWIAHFVKSILWIVPSLAILVLLLCISWKDETAILNYSNPFLLFVFFLLYEICNICLCFAISTFISHANLAGIITGVIFFFTFVPFFTAMTRYNELSNVLKVFYCFLPNTNMAFGIYHIMMKESHGIGMDWHNLFNSSVPDDFLSLAFIMSMCVVNSVIYLLITWYMTLAFPGEYGVPMRWYFPFTTKYWFERKPAVQLIRKPLPSSLAMSMPLAMMTPSSVSIKDKQKQQSFKSNYTLNHQSSNSSTSLTPDLFQAAPPDPTTMESEPKNLLPGIQIKSLCKSHDGGRSYAVFNLNLNIFHGQITALLGHNGAGKTTTISLLTGLYQPTSGTALVNGADICTDMNVIRHSLGICPQFNILFDELTVREHLEFYCKQKKTGLNNREIKVAVKEMINKLDLVDKTNVRSAQLSGGMKRKLSVGIALIGGSKIVILDEPTSGMDVSARRFIWDLLLQEKRNRTILLSTHFMEEADILGDRIAIMSGGRLQCYGSPLFLKRRFGTGYHLTVAKQSNDSVDTETITDTVKRHIPNAMLESSIGTEVTYSLPSEATGKFQSLLSQIEQDRSLSIANYTISVTTMEEVFLKVGEYARSKMQSITNGNGNSNGNRASSITNTATDNELWIKTPEFLDSSDSSEGSSQNSHRLRRSSSLARITKNHGITLFGQQMYALLVKKLLYIRRSPYLTLAQLVMPFAILNVTMLTLRAVPRLTDSPTLHMELSQFDHPQVTYFYTNSTTNIAQQYVRSLQSQITDSKLIVGVPIQDTFDDVDGDGEQQQIIIQTIANTPTGVYSYDFMISAIIHVAPDYRNRSQMALYLTGLFNNQAYHTPSIAVKHLDETYLRWRYNLSSLTLTVTNHPLPSSPQESVKKSTNSIQTQFEIMQGLIVAIAALAGSFAVLTVKERITKGKQLQRLSGVRMSQYWLTYFMLDYVIYLLSCALMVVVFLLWTEDGLYQSWQPLYLFLGFALHGFAILPCVYVLSFMFSASATAYARLCLYITVVGLATVISDQITSTESLGLMDKNRIMRPIFALLVPVYNLGRVANNLILNYISNQVCNNPAVQAACRLENTTHQLVSCCKDKCNDPSSSSSSSCIEWESNYLSIHEPGIGRYLFYMMACGLVYLTILCAIEYKFLRHTKRICSTLVSWCCCCCCKRNKPSSGGRLARTVPYDSDVAQEAHRVASLTTNPMERRKYPLIVEKLVKKYGGRFTAVRGISYAVNRGECFGMLGINGAGKTTTFEMITGDTAITSGDVYVNGKNNKQSLRNIQQEIGYCPQFDAMLDDLTGEETLRMYARLRGIQEMAIAAEIKDLSELLYFEMHLQKLVSQYSGGNKRKLSTAIALLGNPSVSFLDEPTTGVDPVARRCLWKAINRKLHEGCSVVLTSHSMEECEALCGRLIIMVNGQICCIGSPLQVKSKYGNGYTLLIRVSSTASSPLTGDEFDEIDLSSSPDDDDWQQSHQNDVLNNSVKRNVEELRLCRNIAKVKQFMKRKFPNSCLKAVHNNVLHYCITNGGEGEGGGDNDDDDDDDHDRPSSPPSQPILRCSEIFGIIERARTEYNEQDGTPLCIEDYSVSQTNLEQIFLSFARMQLEEGAHNVDEIDDNNNHNNNNNIGIDMMQLQLSSLSNVPTATIPKIINNNFISTTTIDTAITNVTTSSSTPSTTDDDDIDDNGPHRHVGIEHLNSNECRTYL